MSPSQNFPARAEPSWSISISELKPRCNFFMYSSFSSILPIFLTQTIIHFINKNQYSLQKISENRVIKVQNAREMRKKNMSGQKCQLSNFRADYFFRADGEKATSQAELKILQLEVWLEPARLGLITTNDACDVFNAVNYLLDDILT